MDFDKLYREYRNRIFQLALRLLRNEEMAIDATQDAFRKAFSARESFSGKAAASSWIFRIAYNSCLNALTSKKGKDLSLDGIVAVENRKNEPESKAETRETQRLIRKAIAEMKEDDRRLLCLQMDDGLSYSDLSTVLNCSLSTVRMRVSRARRRLKEILAPQLEPQK